MCLLNNVCLFYPILIFVQDVFTLFKSYLNNIKWKDSCTSFTVKNNIILFAVNLGLYLPAHANDDNYYQEDNKEQANSSANNQDRKKI